MAFIESGKTFDKEDHYGKMKKHLVGLEISQYSLRIPTHLYKRVKIKLAKDNLKLRSVLVNMLEEYLRKS